MTYAVYDSPYHCAQTSIATLGEAIAFAKAASLGARQSCDIWLCNGGGQTTAIMGRATDGTAKLTFHGHVTVEAEEMAA